MRHGEGPSCERSGGQRRGRGRRRSPWTQRARPQGAWKTAKNAVSHRAHSHLSSPYIKIHGKTGARADQVDECQKFVSFRRPLTPEAAFHMEQAVDRSTTCAASASPSSSTRRKHDFRIDDFLEVDRLLGTGPRESAPLACVVAGRVRAAEKAGSCRSPAGRSSQRVVPQPSGRHRRASRRWSTRPGFVSFDAVPS